MKSSIDVDGKMIIKCYKACVLIWCCFISYGNSVPIDYCLHPLDNSDCGLKPTPVFSYYKSGSRCEIEMWRGCPTFNKFPDEFLCSHHCIGKLWGRTDESQFDMMSLEVEEDRPFDECRVPMNESDCGVQDQLKYTFIDSLCIRVAWKGCQSNNMFDDEETCVNACNPQTNSDLKNQLEELPIDDVKEISNILDDVMTESTASTPKIMQMKLNIDTPTEPREEKTTTVDTTVEPDTTTAETVTETSATTNEVVETVVTTKALETTTSIEETTSTTLKTTDEVTEEATTTTTTTEATTTTNEATTIETTSTTEATTTTEGDGSADEVVLT